MTHGRDLRRCLSLGLAAGAVIALATSACTLAAPTSSAAAGTATAFYTAIDGADGAAACRLLAPATIESVEKDADRPHLGIGGQRPIDRVNNAAGQYN
ncbi:hypothetical protein Cch01nite_43560 [Cellulomonas chitinilytica]|uniref:Uncharacterized protein n=1 Tax=Cellulomonas chitinilytica TaxID=398759 RepID=A0A919U4N5_9CELL|nr:hypothetical protein [Cellulomonas chitinilytica]GIG23632.1 hypothetical protein Cch01nite_43560 [Cellulomonas chitinilytica]